MSAAPAGVEEVCELGAAVLGVCAEVLVHFVEGLVLCVGRSALVGVGAEEDDADGVGGGGGGGEEGHEVGGENDVACGWIVKSVVGLKSQADWSFRRSLPQWFRAKCSSTPIFESWYDMMPRPELEMVSYAYFYEMLKLTC